MKRTAVAAIVMLAAATMAQDWTPTKTAPGGTPDTTIPISHGMLQAYVGDDSVTIAFGNGEVQIRTSVEAKDERDLAKGLLRAMDRTFPQPQLMKSHHRFLSGSPVPGGLCLPVGLINVPDRGRDTHVGRIEGTAGEVWRYDIGNLAGDYTTGPAVWKVTGKVRGMEASIARKADGTVAVHIGDANFVASPKTRKSLVTVLVSSLTYRLSY